MDKETETVINRLMSDLKAAQDLSAYLAANNKKLREALQNKQRPDGESIQGVIAWIKEDQDRLMKFRAALKEEE